MKWEPDEPVRLTPENVRRMLGKELQLPKYTSPIINLANRFAQATRPKVVGKVSELVKECPYKDFEGWKHWYLEKYPEAIEDATDKIMKMIDSFKEVLDNIDRDTVRKWVEDLVLVKTFIGLNVQEPILSFLASKTKLTYRLSTPEEESAGIDGFIGDFAVSVKPVTYREKERLAGELPRGDVVIYYEKDRENNITISEVEALTEKGKKFIKLLETLEL
ncbi:MjaI family restriction endonuclease [Archaeoglobus veneficus]|uniref:Type II site-specific deoxyribonuclease n=1 Tax=Archaeoglobus veneficus (strain DSM 11195 / SNP6) TaxID=693661 RepID=F2KNP7_ARCVS|nr:MjaI family restriction endonuclease [Archaeoglobus veneficus]AEA46275.1 Type II site-specific deoxyribonuclease [Archaeoglobus veneficus SNP6]